MKSFSPERSSISSQRERVRSTWLSKEMVDLMERVVFPSYGLVLDVGFFEQSSAAFYFHHVMVLEML